MQINVRLDTTVVDQLEAHAKANRVSFSEEVRQRIIASLVPKPELSLSEFRSDWLRRLRDAVEHSAPPLNIEKAWRCLQAVDAGFTGFYTKTENELFHYVANVRVRELLRGRGALALPDETKAKQE